MTHAHPGHRRRRLHRLGAGPPSRARTRRTSVLNVDKLTYAGNPPSLAPTASGSRAIAFVEADICDAPRMRAAVRGLPPRRGDAPGRREPCRPLDRRRRRPSSRPTSSAPSRCWRRRAATGAALAERRRRRFRFHHVSTDEVFGSLGADGAVHRDDALRPELALFGVARRRPTIWCAPGTTPTACRCVITNCSNNYGPYQFPEKLIPLIILNALEGKPLPVYGDGAQRPRLALRRGPRPRAGRRCWSAAGSARPTDRRPRRAHATSRWSQAICDAARRSAGRAARPRARADQLRHRPARPRPPLRHRRRRRSSASSAGRRRRRFESGLARPCDWYLDNDGWWQPHPRRRLYAASGWACVAAEGG